MKETVNVIVVHWDEKIPYNKQNVLALNKPHDYGIYAIYGEHYAYGKEALLYIGMAQERKFCERMNDGDRVYYDFEESTIVPTYMRLGFICKPEDGKAINIMGMEDYENNWKSNIAIVEKILIATHTPALNRRLSNKLADQKFNEDYLIINKGDFGSLLPEVSTIRNSYKYYDFQDNYLKEK
jgi:hypothetical protein